MALVHSYHGKDEAPGLPKQSVELESWNGDPLALPFPHVVLHHRSHTRLVERYGILNIRIFLKRQAAIQGEIARQFSIKTLILDPYAIMND